jgi:isocitrate dehydrogenase
MFEAIHGSAPDIAGQDIANPTGLLHGAIMMLVHIGQTEVANNIRNALYKTIEDGIHTADIFNENSSKKKVGTKEFTREVISRLGQKPSQLPLANFSTSDNKTEIKGEEIAQKTEKRTLIGFDLFVEWSEKFDDLLEVLKGMESEKLEVKMISAKGLLLWPHLDKHMMPNYAGGQTILRFIGKGITGKSSNDIIDAKKIITHQDIIEMLSIMNQKEIDFVKYEGLYLFDGKPGYTSGQGE